MTRKLFRLFVVLLWVIPFAVFAVGLGPIQVRSALNQRLDAEIELVKPKPGELESLSVRLASPQAFEQAGIEHQPLLSDLEFAVQARPDGRGFIKVTSSRPIREPFLNFLVEINGSKKGRVLREFTVFLDPPTYRDPISPPAAVAPMDRARSSPTPTPAITYQGGDVYGPVAPGETLSQIANRVRPRSVSLAQMMQALLKTNPHAFYKFDVDHLLAGASLQIPTLAEITANDRPPPQALAQSSKREPKAAQVRLVTPQGPLQPGSIPLIEAPFLIQSQGDDIKLHMAEIDNLQTQAALKQTAPAQADPNEQTAAVPEPEIQLPAASPAMLPPSVPPSLPIDSAQESDLTATRFMFLGDSRNIAVVGFGLLLLFILLAVLTRRRQSAAGKELAVMPVVTVGGAVATGATVVPQRVAEPKPPSPNGVQDPLERADLLIQEAVAIPGSAADRPLDPVDEQTVLPWDGDFIKVGESGEVQSPATEQGMDDNLTGEDLADSGESAGISPPSGEETLAVVDWQSPVVEPAAGAVEQPVVQEDLEAHLQGLNFDLEAMSDEVHGEATADKGQEDLETYLQDLDLDLATISEPDHAAGKAEAGATEQEPITEGDYVDTKLDLALAYLDMEDPIGARSLLEEVLYEGSADQKRRAQELISHIHDATV